MASPVIGNNVGNGADQLKNQIVGWIRDEIAAATRGGLGLHIDGATGDLVADRGQFRSLNFVPGSAGWGMAPSGNAEFNDLTLRGGIIGNQALTSPTSPQTFSGRATNFGLTTASTTKLSLTIPVPAGFTAAAVNAIGRMYAINNNAGLDYLYANAQIDSFVGIGLPTVATGSGGPTVNVAPCSTVLTGLTPGGTFAIQVIAATSFYNWSAATSNSVDLSGSITWYR